MILNSNASRRHHNLPSKQIWEKPYARCVNAATQVRRKYPPTENPQWRGTLRDLRHNTQFLNGADQISICCMPSEKMQMRAIHYAAVFVFKATCQKPKP